MSKHETLYDLFMQAPAAIAVLRGKNHVFEFTNERYLRLVGKPATIIGKPVREVFPELKGQGFFEIIDKVFKTGEPFVGNAMPIELDMDGSGKLVKNYLNFVYQPLKDTGGKVDGIMAHAVDVTDQIVAQKLVEENEARYSTLFNSIDQGFCIIEVIFDTHNKAVDYQFIEVNRLFEKQTGLKNATGKLATKIVPGLEDYWIKTYGTVALTGKSIRFSQNSEAMGRWYDLYATKIGDSKSRRVAVLFTDISKSKKAEQALKESEERHRTIVETLEEGVTVLDSDGHIVSANKSAERLLGLTRDQMRGRSSLDPRWKSIHEDGTAMPGEEHAPQYVLRTNKAFTNQMEKLAG